MEGNYAILFLILFPLVCAILGYFVGKKKPESRNDIVDVAVIVETVIFGYLCFTVLKSGNPVHFSWEDFCGFGIKFTLDEFRAIYGTLAAIIWLLATIFSKEYFAKTKDSNRYYMFNLITLGATIGVLISADLYTLFMFFELMSLSSYTWVIDSEEKKAMKAGGTYLTVTLIGGFVMLMGMGLIYSQTGTLTFAGISKMMSYYGGANGRMWLAGILLVAGFGAKACMYPLHIWLPDTYGEAPAPGSALLSAMLTKTGIYGILVISIYAFFGNHNWGMFILIAGAITMFVGAFFALFNNNMKKILAYSSMSHIGFILVGIGTLVLLGKESAIPVTGTFLHMMNHSLVKISLFLVAGIVFMNTGKLELNEIRGYGKNKPLLMIAFLVGGACMAGIPLTSGYISKTLIHKGLVEYIELVKEGAITGFGNYGFVKTIEWIFLISGGCTLAYMTKIFIAVFIEKGSIDEEVAKVETTTDEETEENTTKKKTSYMKPLSAVAILVPTVYFIVCGILPHQTIEWLGKKAIGFISVDTLEEVNYFSWTNLSGALISIVIGILIYIVIIRGLFMKKSESGVRVYVDRWPEWLTLENCLYRPILMVILPTIGTFFGRICDWIIDGPIVMLRRTVFRDNRRQATVHYGSAFTDSMGLFLDNFKGLLNCTILKKHPIDKSFVQILAVKRNRIKVTKDLVTKSVSFSLLMFAVGFVFTIIYMMLLIK